MAMKTFSLLKLYKGKLLPDMQRKDTALWRQWLVFLFRIFRTTSLPIFVLSKGEERGIEENYQVFLSLQDSRLWGENIMTFFTDVFFCMRAKNSLIF